MGEEIPVHQPEVTPYRKAAIATENAFTALIVEATKLGLHTQPVMGLMYLPDQNLTADFQKACRAILRALGAGDIDH